MSLQEDLELLLSRAREVFAGSPAAAPLATLSARLGGPLRVALAGRVKAGKSTLLNALIGERLAPTDAGECTRIVTWYEYGDAYDVRATLADGTERPLRFTREDGRLAISLDEGDQPARITVSWPARRLRDMTLIDTPGIGSVTAGVSERTLSFLGARQPEPRADAVVYLMRHLHASDAALLEAFLDEQAAEVTPVNSVAVLSRCDEVGGGRLGAMESGRRIAARYAADPRVRTLASAVLPIAALLAETAATLEEHEGAALALLAGEPDAVTRAMLVSVDAFRSPDLGPLTVELREQLLARLGLYGVRLALAAAREGRWASSPALARLLWDESGVETLSQLIRDRFAARARPLVARSVLASLTRVVLEAEEQAVPGAPDLLVEIEKLQSRSREMAQLRMLDLVWSGVAAFSDEERTEAERVTGDAALAERAGCPPGADAGAVRAAAVAGAARWRERASGTLGGRLAVLCCETMAESYEALYAAAAG